MNYIKFGGVKSSNFNVFVSGKEKIKLPKKDVEFVSVPGRNGDIEFDNNRYENVIIKYPAYIPSSLSANYDKVSDWLTRQKGYVRLEDSFHPDEFRLGVFHAGLDVKPSLHHIAGRFDLEFNCKPQRFLKSGGIYFNATNGQLIKNPTKQIAKPLLEIVGSGFITIEGITIVIASNSYSSIKIDCETETAYYGNINLNSLLTLKSNKFFKLQPYPSEIEFSSGITRIKICPRWWILWYQRYIVEKMK